LMNLSIDEMYLPFMGISYSRRSRFVYEVNLVAIYDFNAN